MAKKAVEEFKGSVTRVAVAFETIPSARWRATCVAGDKGQLAYSGEDALSPTVALAKMRAVIEQEGFTWPAVPTTL